MKNGRLFLLFGLLSCISVTVRSQSFAEQLQQKLNPSLTTQDRARLNRFFMANTFPLVWKPPYNFQTVFFAIERDSGKGIVGIVWLDESYTTYKDQKVVSYFGVINQHPNEITYQGAIPSSILDVVTGPEKPIGYDYTPDQIVFATFVDGTWTY